MIASFLPTIPWAREIHDMRAGRRANRQPQANRDVRHLSLGVGLSSHTRTHTTGHFNSSSEQTAPHASSTASPSSSGPGPRLSSRPSFLTGSQFPHPTDREAGGSSPVPAPSVGLRLPLPSSLPFQPPTWDPALGCSDGSQERGAAAPWTRPDTGRRAGEAHRAPRRWWRRQLQERPPRRLMTHGRGVGGGEGGLCLPGGDAGG